VIFLVSDLPRFSLARLEPEISRGINEATK
jgi:hypothetical protein